MLAVNVLEKGKRKYLVFSTILHLVLIFSVAVTCGRGGKGKGKGGKEDGQAGIAQEDKGKILPKNIEVTIVEHKAGEGELKIKAVPKPKQQERGKDGFWGIGVHLSFLRSENVQYNGQFYMGIAIEQVIYGNPAHLAGILPGDLVFLVNGKQYTGSDDDESASIRGKGPGDITLGILRNGKIIFIKLRRDWIETTGRQQGDSNP